MLNVKTRFSHGFSVSEIVLEVESVRPRLVIVVNVVEVEAEGGAVTVEDDDRATAELEGANRRGAAVAEEAEVVGVGV